MQVGAFYLPSVGHMEDIQKGMAGKRTDLYQMMLREITEQLQYMDANGYYGCGFTEHHFHVEGEEVSTNPVILDLYFGMQTKRMKFGQLGNVLPSQNPINLAENIAMVSQMLQGRVFAGFARGYQPRWVNVLGQQIGLSDPGAGEEYEDLKRSLFEEHFDIIMEAWKNDTFSFKGKHWQVPTKDIKWAAAEVAWNYGQGCNKDGIIEEIGIAPPTYDKQIPDLFMPFATSERSIKWGMSRGIVPVTIMTHYDVVKEHFRAGMEAANEAGMNYKFGQGMAMSREIIVADTDAEAEAIAREAGSFIWNNFFVPFGFNAAVAGPGEGPWDMPATFETISERGLVIHGSPDTVNRKLEKLLKELPVDYFWMFIYNHMPHDQCMKSLELMTEKVWPNFTDAIGGGKAAQKSAG
ncbi:MAG: LLM class flavin-dependent oxidoreductase [Gammaproteobacteria bacterium]|nr:LLM class flavin-dependent oxidoreductase [Gammaproteobacteria bacterium]MCP5198924.1 LLM class flavin-dependent oxidoreductase [Gammaproteobacteria bacterium]